MEDKTKKNKWYVLILCFSIYTGAIIIQNILASKQIDIWIFTMTTGVLISPLIFIIQDVVSDLFGFKTARNMILLGFGMNLLAVLLFTVAIYIPGSQFWFNQQSFSIILGTTFRISCASFVAYLIGSLCNTKIMTVLKNKYPNNLFVRAITSTVVGQFLDNAVFSLVAFIGVLPFNAILTMIFGATIFEILYEICFYPLTKLIIKKIEKIMR